MTKILLLASFSFLLCFGHGAAAEYRFSIKVINKTGHDLDDSVSVKWSAKTDPTGLTPAQLLRKNVACWIAEDGIRKGEPHQEQCTRRGAFQKWKRNIKVEFTCPTYGGGKRTIYFPRGKKWYDRGHAQNNSDQYTVKLKSSDC
jgi:hypothetical protein